MGYSQEINMLIQFLWRIGRRSQKFRRFAYWCNFKWAWWGIGTFIEDHSLQEQPTTMNAGVMTLRDLEKLWDFFAKK